MASERKNLVIILGPTGVGKSTTAFFLAREFDGEIINCDSMQVYQEFNVGTNKSSPEMRALVPHHLLDIVSAASQYTAADFVKDALAALASILAKRRLPFVVGGTGFYLKALLDGLFPGPGRDSELRRRLEKEASEKGLESLRQKLEKVDPLYSQKIGKRDKIRIIRALEVYELTQKPLSDHFWKTRSHIEDFHLIKIGLKLERAVLYKKIEERVDHMFQNGIVQEVESLLERGVDEDSPPFHALGYKYVLKLLKEEIPLEEAKNLTKRDTRRYAKRQMTWFRKMEGIAWFSPDDRDMITDFLESRLN